MTAFERLSPEDQAAILLYLDNGLSFGELSRAAKRYIIRHP